MDIFRPLLLTRYTKRAAPYTAAVPHALQPAVLRVCRKFWHEASDILYRENALVHVVTNYYDLAFDLAARGISAICRGRQAFQFPRYSLHTYLNFHAKWFNKYHFMIGAEDLQLFCSLFWLLSVRRQYQMSLRLTLPSASTERSPSFFKQESLVLPFQELWHIADAAVHGPIDPEIAARLKAALTERVPHLAEKKLELALSLKDGGDRCILQSEYFGSAVQYYKAFAICNALEDSLWNVDSELKQNAKNLSIRLKLDLSLAYLKLHAWRDAEESANAAIGSFRCSFWAEARSIAHYRRAMARKGSQNLEGAAWDLAYALRVIPVLSRDSAFFQHMKMEEYACNAHLERARAKFHRPTLSTNTGRRF